MPCEGTDPRGEWTRERMRRELWDCYCESGGDPSGADARHLNPGEALAAVSELRGDHNAALAEIDAVERERDQYDSSADWWAAKAADHKARVERLEAALRDLCEKAELYLDEPEPTVLTPNPEHGKAAGALWRAVDVAREALAPEPVSPDPVEEG